MAQTATPVAGSATAMPEKDVDLRLHGSLNFLTPITPAAQNWLGKHVSPYAMWFGGSLAVEPRYCPDIVEGMIDDGLAVYLGDALITSVTL